MVGRLLIRGILAFSLVALLLSLVASAPVAAQNYRFSVDRNVSRIFVNRDASIDIEYWLTFTCDRGAIPIDIIDVGFPNGEYELSDVRASLDETPITRIYESEYVTHGVEVHLGQHAIRPGNSGTLYLKARVRDMVFPDSDDENYASVRFSPTWYDSSFTRGSTFLQVSFYLPEGVQPEEPRYHDKAFTEATIEGERVVYTWIDPSARPDRQYLFGASFPKQYVDRVVQPPPFDWEALVFGALLPFLMVGGFVVGIVAIIIFSIKAERRRRMAYLPPTLKVEGVDVRRGLTAPEAAVLMEMPLNKVLTLISFGLVRKGAMRVLSRDPLRVEAIDPAPADLRDYEKSVLAAIGKNGKLNERALREVVIELVRAVERKMKGFSRRDTVAYYQSIVSKAWERVKGEGEIELTDDDLAETVEWTSLDQEFERRAPEVWVGRSFRRPIWWDNYSPRPARSGDGGRGPGGSPPRLPDVSLPTLPGSEFASSMVGGLEGFANSVVSNLESFTSRVTGETNPPPPPSRSSRGGRSGGGCACACACAGCACACAGGGR